MQPAYREASLRATHRGVERPVAATSSFSKDFHTFPRKFQAFPRKFQAFPRKFQAFPNFSKDFQTFFLGRFEENQGVIARSGRNRVFSKFLRRLGRDERPRGALPNALAIQHSANSDYRKEIVGGDFGEGPPGKRGVACANAKADRRGAGAVQLRRGAPSFLMEASFFRNFRYPGARDALVLKALAIVLGEHRRQRI